MQLETGQIVCECGRVAEIRRRKNGQQLPFKSCKSCGVQQGKEELREKWLAEMQPNIGAYGEFADGRAPEVAEPAPASKPEKTADWKPEGDLKPEIAEPEAEEQETEKPEKNNIALLGGGLLLGALAIFLGVKSGKLGVKV